MSFSDDLLTILTDYHGGHKLMLKRILSGWPQYFPENKLKNQTLKTTLYRLKKRGLIKNEKGIWGITKDGIEFLKNRSLSKKPHFSNTHKNKQKDLIIIFDIPENKRKIRDWLRGELKTLGFTLVQKSVWIGSSPLPQELIKYLSKIDILSHIKFFKVNEEDLI